MLFVSINHIFPLVSVCCTTKGNMTSIHWASPTTDFIGRNPVSNHQIQPGYGE